MSLWWWLLAWVLLLLASFGYLGWRVWGLWQHLRATWTELETAMRTLTMVHVQADLPAPAGAAPAGHPAAPGRPPRGTIGAAPGVDEAAAGP